MITLTRNGTTLELTDRLLWIDEYAYSPVVREDRFGTTGRLIVHAGTKQAGRPITLDGIASKAWITRLMCQQLNAWAAIADAQFVLVLRGVARTVELREFRADPIWPLADAEIGSETVYVPFFKFLEV